MFLNYGDFERQAFFHFSGIVHAFDFSEPRTIQTFL